MALINKIQKVPLGAMETWKKNIIRLLAEKKWSHEVLAEKIGVTRGQIGHYLRSRRQPPIKRLKQIADVFDITLNELLSSPLMNSMNSTDRKELAVLLLGEVKKWTEHPILTQTLRRMQMFFSDRQLGDKSYLLEVTGDAMISPLDPRLRIEEGDLLLIDPKIEATPGKLVVAYIKSEDDEKLRRLTTDGKKRILEAYNPKYPNIIVNDDVEILGVVISLQRSV